MGELVEVRDTRLFVEERGSGLPVVVLHGGPGADHTQLLDPLLPLADEFRLLFVDQRAQGRSERAPAMTWTLKEAATDVTDLARSLSLHSYAVLGHSYGALVSLRHAIDYPGSAAASVISHGVPSSRWYRLMEELDRLEPEEVRRVGEDLTGEGSQVMIPESDGLTMPTCIRWYNISIPDYGFCAS